ncbi:hypothetical protein [Croceitalea sp. MTPC5]|uniref:hypothetical protein n=1 Tax=Croceitalea sp. MTPC5 TaxID=3056565 RepID=UPI0030D59C38
MTSDEVPLKMLNAMFQISDIDHLVDFTEMDAVEYFLIIYSHSLGNDGIMDLTIGAEKLNTLIRCWNYMLGIELLRRENIVKVQPCKIFDFHGMLENQVTLEVPKTIIQSFLN